MTDDFLRLVSQSNPATRQYQPANNGYPPSSSSAGLYSDNQSPNPQLLDPFFDDDDDNMPDSAFARPGPMQSQDSGLPLTKSAAPPAGTRPSGDGIPQGWNFDDDDFQPAHKPFDGSDSFSGVQPANDERSKPPRRKWKWKWPWQKEKVLTGERVIALNNSPANAEFGSNFVSTSKYNVATFLGKFLLGMFLPG